MEKWTKHQNIVTKAVIGLISCSFNPNPNTSRQRLIKGFLKHFSYLRKAIIYYAVSILDLDIYNLQAIAILAQAGVHNPRQNQITTIEQLLKVK
jgi:hypothetical protein